MGCPEQLERVSTMSLEVRVVPVLSGATLS